MAIDIRTGTMIGRCKTNEDWVLDYRRKHGDLYDYPNISYKSTQHFDVLCKTHGLFSITPSNHRAGKGCPACADLNRYKKQVKTLEQILTDFFDKHNHTYDYSLIDYINAKTKVKIICKDHRGI